MNKSNKSLQTSNDPRIRRTRTLLQTALQTLLMQKGYNDISITDICKQADVARVTFYQHYDSKDVLLLATVSDFFTNFSDVINVEVFKQFIATGELDPQQSLRAAMTPDPSQVTLIRVALKHIGFDVRQRSIASLQATLSAHDTALNESQTAMLSAFYIGGIMTLMEQLMSGESSLSVTDFQAATLPLLRAARQAVLAL